MRQFLALLVSLPCVALSLSAISLSGEPEAATACSYLDIAAVSRIYGDDPSLPGQQPDAEPAGQGSACFYADVILQVDPFSREFIERTVGADAQAWEPVSGIGDRAYFRDRGGDQAELMGWVGERTFTLQAGVPATGSVEAVRADVLTLASTIAARLK